MAATSGSAREVVLLDYGAGNVQSIYNAIESLGFTLRRVETAEDILTAQRLLFPGVGAFGTCVQLLKERGWFEPLRQYLKENRPFFGICLGMQTLFESSEESPGVEGLGILPGPVVRFPQSSLAVPNIGWNGVSSGMSNPWPLSAPQPRCYFVHSYYVPLPEAAPWVLGMSEYGLRYVCAVRTGNIVGCQFHPEKSGRVGLEVLRRWLEEPPPEPAAALEFLPTPVSIESPARRVIACLDVRSNDQGDLVVTKGDQYDVREAAGETGAQPVRNLGKPVELASRYYQEGADEVSFLNITAFREVVLDDQPMLSMLRAAAACVYVPLTVGGGIRAYTDGTGKTSSAVEVADAYFRAGADKVSIGTDSIQAARDYYANGRIANGSSSIEQISKKYGRQAVVISVDPRRMYSAEPLGDHTCAPIAEGSTTPPGPNGERFVWYCCTAKGGRENTELDVVQLAQAVEVLGAGELLLNCIDRDGQGSGYELELVRMVKAACALPVIASSGAGNPAHFEDALKPAAAGGGGADAALAAGIFHRREVPLESVKAHLSDVSIPVRR
jgi:glutamine amidotransferase/cyclase